MPITIAEAIRGATVEVPTLTGTKRIRVPAGHPARHRPAAARRGPAEARRQAAAATSTTGSRSTCPSSLTQEQEKAVDDLAEVMNGNPRERPVRGEEVGDGEHEGTSRDAERRAASS